MSRADLLKAATFLKANLDRIDRDDSNVIKPQESGAFAEALWPTKDVFAKKRPGGNYSLADDLAGALAPMAGQPRPAEANRFHDISVSNAGVRLDQLVDEVLAHPERYDADGDGRFEGNGQFGAWLIDIAHELKTSGTFARFQPAAGGVSWTTVDSTPTVPVPATSSAEGLQRLVGDLEVEVRTLEAANTRKLGEIEALVTSIAARKRELESEYNRQRNIGLIGAIFGAPMVSALSIVEMQRTDGRLSELNAKLAAAQKDQTALAQEAARHAALKARVEATLGSLRQAVPVAARPAPVGGEVGRVLSKAEDAARSAAVLENLTQQRDALLELRGSARELGGKLDAVLHRLSADLAEAQRQVDASKKATLELLKVLVAQDPNKAALNRLTGMARAEFTRQFEPMVDRMLATVREPQVKAELKKRLMKALGEALVPRPAPAPAPDPDL